MSCVDDVGLDILKDSDKAITTSFIKVVGRRVHVQRGV